MRTIGLDLSLTSTGIGLVDSDGTYATMRVKPNATLRGHDRLDWILDHITTHIGTPNLIVIEGPSYGSEGRGQHERAGLWWLVTHRLWSAHQDLAIAPPTCVKRYATGKGNAGKDDVLREVVRRFATFNGGNDEADALVLAAMGADQLGWPVVAMPAAHRTALAPIEWPAHIETKEAG